jgi:23S rRNA (uridine2552-2'-O)-methyltransferase
LRKLKNMAVRKSNDHFARRAKAMGYPARSVFKLEEILERHPVVKKGMRLLDLGAAPGSWSLYLAKKREAQVVSADLKPLEVKHEGIIEVRGDIFSEETGRQLAAYGPYDAVVSDAAPATSGDRLVDASRSQELALQALLLAVKYLKKGGFFLVKVFQNGGEQELLDTMKKSFTSVKILKPKAVRSESFEVYFLGQSFNGESTVL